MLTPFLLLPLVARVGGSEAWVAINVGQSVGALGAILAGLGWPLTGSAQVAAADALARSRIYAESVAARIPSTLLATVGAGLISGLLAPDSERAIAVLMAVAMAAGGALPTWYSIGIGRPGAIARYETLPRVAATGLSAIWIIASGQIAVYPVLLLITTVAGAAAYGRRVVGVRLRDLAGINPFAVIWSTRTSIAAMFTSASYALTPVPISATVSAIGSAASFSSADRLFRFGLIGVQVFVNAFQNWLVDGEGELARISRSRTRTAALVVLGVGGLGALVLAVGGPLITTLLFGSLVAASQPTCVLYAVAFAAIAASSALGRLVLIPRGRHGVVFASTLIGAVVGLPVMVVLGGLLGSEGVAVGFAISELAVTGVQGVVVLGGRIALRGSRSGG